MAHSTLAIPMNAAGTVKQTYDALELITDERFANNKTLASIAREQKAP